MKIKHLLVGLFCLLGFHSFAQTKLIAHKSHSGSNATFKLALKSGLRYSNFGLHEFPVLEVKKITRIKNNRIIIEMEHFTNFDTKNRKSKVDTIPYEGSLEDLKQLRDIRNSLIKKYGKNTYGKTHFRKGKNFRLIDKTKKSQHIDLDKKPTKPTKKIKEKEHNIEEAVIIKKRLKEKSITETKNSGVSVVSIKQTQLPLTSSSFVWMILTVLFAILFVLGTIVWRLLKLELLNLNKV